MTTRLSSARTIPNRSNGFLAARPAILGVFRLLALGFSSVASAAPLVGGGASAWLEHNDGDDPDDDGTPLWIYFVATFALVIAGGIFAGLTIALMGQDSIYLQVLASDKDEPQHINASRVLKLLKSGKHWVLVTLLLSNVVVNESLPLVLDRCFGGGVAAIVGSTVLIVIFGEVVPQSVCVRYGLQVGGYMSKPVLLLMWLTSPISWPTAKLLDWVLGEDHGTVYKKSGLKTLVTLHRSVGVASERLNKDEVTIISAVLDLKDKPVAAVMTPMEDVFVMSEDTVLDEQTMDTILSAGYSRIPIHESGNPTNFLGMLLVKILITYDPEDCLRVKDFPLATLPETRPETSCLDIVNYFQEGKSHMVLVSESPGNPFGALGVVTLEDVIEELIGEEIVDESDVYIDVHKAIRRLHPAPNAQMFRRQSAQGLAAAAQAAENAPGAAGENGSNSGSTLKVVGENIVGASPNPAADLSTPQLGSSPKTATFLMRRSSAGLDGKMVSTPVPVRANFSELKEHLKHLGPSNLASNPKDTRVSTVKIKPGSASSPNPSHPRSGPVTGGGDNSVVHDTIPEASPAFHVTEPNDDLDAEADENTSLLRRPKSPLGTPKDGVQALRQSYGSAQASDAQMRLAGTTPPKSAIAGTGAYAQAQKSPKQDQVPTAGSARGAAGRSSNGSLSESGAVVTTVDAAAGSDSNDSSPISEGQGSFPSTPRIRKSTTARSGSITENIFESRGFRKVVLETTSNEDEAAHVGRDRASTRGSARGQVSDVEEEGTTHHRLGDDDSDDDDIRSGVSGVGTASDNPSGSQPAHKKKNRRKKRKGKS